MRFLLPICAVFLTLTLVTRAAYSVQQFHGSDLVGHVHDDGPSNIDYTSPLNALMAHQHIHEHKEHSPHQDDSSAPLDQSGGTNEHSHSHTHVLNDYSAWVATDSTLETPISALSSVFSSADDEIYFFDFLSRIFRPPIV